MQKLNLSNLEYFYDVDNERQEIALNKIKNYCFKDNLNLIRELLNKPDLLDAVFRSYVDNKDNLYVRLSLYENSRFISYCIDAYNVYTGSFSADVLEKDKELSKTWRNIMKSCYDTKNYVEDAKKALQQERQDLIDYVNSDINNQLESL